MKFGDYLRDQRNEKGWTQPEAAEHCGIEQSYLSKLENGKAFPSEEVFEKLRSAYDLDIAAVCDQVSDPELEKMREVGAIRTMLNGRARKTVRAYRTALLLGAALVVLGSGLLAHWGWVSHSPNLEYYVYESKGVVLEGESPYLFKSMPTSRDLARMNGHAYDNFFRSAEAMQTEYDKGRLSRAELDTYLLRLELRDRLDYDTLTYGNHRGEMFIEPADGGSRTYTLVDRREKEAAIHTAAYFIFGVMFVVSGLLSFFVGSRWR